MVDFGVKLCSLLVEPRESLLSRVQVGVLSLPLFQVERGFREVIQGVLGFGLFGYQRLLLVLIYILLLGCLLLLGSRGSSSGLSLWLLSFRLLLLCRGLVGGLLNELDVSEDRLELVLVVEAAN